MKLFIFAASTRKDSTNKKLISNVSDIIKELGSTADLADFREFDTPLYDQDVNEEKGIPEGAKKFIQRLKAANGTIISVPEYNFTIPGPLKNLIDWASRDTPMPWRQKHILLVSASPALAGGNRGLWNTRIPFECTGAFVYPDMYSLSNSYEEFDEKGNFINQTRRDALKKVITGFLEHLADLKHVDDPSMA